MKMSPLVSAKHCQIICWFLGAFTLLVNGQQVDLNGPSLGSGRQFYCLNEELVFMCTGSGLGIQWTVPPLFSAEGFLNTETPPLTRTIGGVDAAINLQQTTPMFITNLMIRNVPDITVECFTDVIGSINTLTLVSSTIPAQVQDVILEVPACPPNGLNVSITWTPVNGSFDFKHYRVQLCNGVCFDVVNTTSSSAEMIVQMNISTGDNVYALVRTESLCGDVGASGKSNSVIFKIFTETVTTTDNEVVTPDNICYPDLTAIIILAVICGVLAISLLIVLGFCIKYCLDVKKIRSRPAVEKLEM